MNWFLSYQIMHYLYGTIILSNLNYLRWISRTFITITWHLTINFFLFNIDITLSCKMFHNKWWRTIADTIFFDAQYISYQYLYVIIINWFHSYINKWWFKNIFYCQHCICFPHALRLKITLTRWLTHIMIFDRNWVLRNLESKAEIIVIILSTS